MAKKDRTNYKNSDKSQPRGEAKDGFDQMVDDPSDNPKPNFKRAEDPGTWKRRFNIAYRNQKDQAKEWAENYEQMYAIKTYKNISIWKSQAFIPVLSYKAWTIIAKLIALRPGFSVKKYSKLYSNEDRKAIDKANLKLEYDYDNPELEESIRDKQFDILTDAVVCGTGFGKAEWVSGTRKVYNHFQKKDGTIDYSKADVTETDYGFNNLDPINAFDVFAAPGRRSFEAKPWIIVKYNKTRSDLLSSDMYDEAAVNALVPTGKSRDTITKYKQSRNQFIGDTQDDQDTLDDTVDSFDIYECYEKTPDGIFLMTFAEASAETKIADGEKADTSKDDAGGEGTADGGNWFEIRNEKQPYWHNKYPIVPAYIRRRPHDCWGENIFEVTKSMANAYNDVFNQLLDNLAIVGNGGILMHETSTTIYDFYYAPGGEVRYSGTKPEFESPQTPDMQIFNTVFSLLDGGVTNATVSPYASGTPSDEQDDTQGTLGGINALQEAAGEITSFMKGSYMQFMKGVGIRWLSNNRQFFDDTLTVAQSRSGKKQVFRITSDDFHEDMMMTIDEDSMQPVTKDQQRANNQAWIADITGLQDRSFMQAGLTANAMTGQPVQPPVGADGQPAMKPIYLDIEKLMAEVNERYDKPDIEEFIIDPAAPQDDTGNDLLIEAIRQEVEDGNIDEDTAQALIDAIEARTPTVMPTISQGDENYATEQEAPTIDTADAGATPVEPVVTA